MNWKLERKSIYLTYNTAMIVDTMTLMEACNYVFKTSKGRMPKIVHEVKSRMNGYKKAIAKKDGMCVFAPIDVSTSNIEIYASCFVKSKTHFKNGGLMAVLHGKFIHQRKTYYYVVMGDMITMEIYTKHFVERYMERHLGLAPTGTEVDIKYFRKYLIDTNGGRLLTSRRPTEKYKHGIYGASEIGVNCGSVLEDSVAVWSTYIDNSTIEKGMKAEAVEVFANSYHEPIVVKDECGNSTFLPNYLASMFG